MAKRYVFWRMPNGRPYKQLDGKHAPAAMLAELGRSSSLTTDEGVSWPLSINHHESELAVRSSAIIIDPDGNELNETDAWAIVWTAIKSDITKGGGGKPIRPDALLVTANALAADHFRKPLTDYLLLTTLSIASLPAKHIRVEGCAISQVSRKCRKYVQPDAMRWRSNEPLWERHLKSTEYLRIRVQTAGRTIHEATGRALDAVNLLRGLWTLFATYGSRTLRLGWVKQEPIGVIHTGPIHTLHKPDGSPAADLFWFDPNYAGDRKLFGSDGKWKQIDKHRSWAMRQMKRLAYRDDLKNLIARYATALDQPDLDVAFLQMWSILEKITDTIGTNYDETIRRATWVFKQRDIAAEQLECLRFRRNQYVHSARSGEERDQVAYMVKAFVDPHLLRLIRDDFKATSLKDYSEFLALPTNVDTLKKRRDRLQRAIRISK